MHDAVLEFTGIHYQRQTACQRILRMGFKQRMGGTSHALNLLYEDTNLVTPAPQVPEKRRAVRAVPSTSYGFTG